MNKKRMTPEQAAENLAARIARYDEHVQAARYLVQNVSPFAEVHVGFGNGKTMCTNEASMPGLCCHRSARTTCGISGCYAMTLQGLYPEYYWCLVRNTALRRRDAGAYYETFFVAAEEAGLPLRVNESGEFENAAQLRAMFAAARRHPSVQVIGYTKRPELLSVIGAECPPSVHLHYSLWTGDAEGERLARLHGVPTCTVSEDWSQVRCPNQLIARENKRRAKLGLPALPAWTCRRCAELGKGCACNRDMVLALHR